MNTAKNLYNYFCKNERQQGDFYPTPDWVSDALLDNCGNDARFYGRVWECACGDGSLAERIKAKCPFAEVYSSDLYNRGYGESGVDFLTSRKEADWIITNPPFEIALEFMLRAEKLAKRGYAFLLPVRYMTGKKRARFYRECPPNRIIVIPQKIDFLGTGNAKMEFAWFMWAKDLERETKVIWHLPEESEPHDLFAA